MKEKQEQMLNQSQINTIIVNTVKQNKNMPLNDLKRVIKDEIREQIDPKKASQIDIDYIWKVIQDNKYIIFEKKEKNRKKMIKNYDDNEGERE